MSDVFEAVIGDYLFDSMLTDRPVKFQKITGWRGLSSTRGSSQAIPGGHGSFSRVNPLRQSLLITLHGFVRTGSHEETVRLLDEIASSIEGATTMGVCDDGGWWYRDIEVKSFDPDDPRGTGYAKFTIDLTATDPVKYRAPTTVGPVSKPVRTGGLRFPARFPWNFGSEDRGRAEIVNTGQLPMYPVLTVSGWGSSVTVHCGPRRLEFGAFSGDLVFDTRQRRAFLHGADVTRQMLRREWPAIPPGETYEIWIESRSAGEMTLNSTQKIGDW